MTIKEIADRLVQLCAEDAVSIEPYATPAFEKEIKGLAAIIEKGKKFESMVETVHNLEVSEPLLAANSFAITMHLNVTMKGQGAMDMTEICLYKVKDGKIISEEFFM